MTAVLGAEGVVAKTANILDEEEAPSFAAAPAPKAKEALTAKIDDDDDEDMTAFFSKLNA